MWLPALGQSGRQRQSPSFNQIIPGFIRPKIGLNARLVPNHSNRFFSAYPSFSFPSPFFSLSLFLFLFGILVIVICLFLAICNLFLLNSNFSRPRRDNRELVNLLSRLNLQHRRRQKSARIPTNAAPDKWAILNLP